MGGLGLSWGGAEAWGGRWGLTPAQQGPCRPGVPMGRIPELQNWPTPEAP